MTAIIRMKWAKDTEMSVELNKRIEALPAPGVMDEWVPVSVSSDRDELVVLVVRKP